jgi:hypothetical protein
MFIGNVGVVCKDVTGCRFSENLGLKPVNSFVHCIIWGVYFV